MATLQTKSSGVSTTGSSGNQSYFVPLAIVTTLFFMWGGITSLNDILVPHLKSIFDLSYAKVMMVQFAFFSGYFIFSMPSGKLIEWIGYKRAMVAGLILAAGMTILQTSANPYVTALGRSETASSRLNLTQAFNSLGTTVFPKVGGLLILSGAVMAPEAMRQLSSGALHDYRVQQAASVKMPYLWLTVALVVLAGLIAISRLPMLAALEQNPTDNEGPQESIWKHRQAVLGALGIFTYVGAEVAIGSFLINYFGYLVGMDEKTASGYVSFYWGGAMVGRFIGSALLQRIRTGNLLMFNAVVAALLTVVSMATNAHVAMWSIIIVGLFNSIMFPSIFTLGVDGLGKLTSKGSALLIAAIVGGAIVPVVQGAIADKIGIHHAFVLPVICYLYIAYFAYDRVKAERANPHAA